MIGKQTSYAAVAAVIAVSAPVWCAQAATTPTTEVAQNKALPIKIQADEMYYNDTSGKVWAKGDVVAQQGNQEIVTPAIEGNTKTQHYEAPGTYRLLEDKGALKNLTGDQLYFEGQSKKMSTKEVSGFVDPYYLKAVGVTFDGQDGLIQQGWITSKSAMAFKGVPDYRIEGKDIQVIPNDKLVVHDAQLYIKNTKILSMKRYVTSLRHTTGRHVNMLSFLPTPSFSGSGFGLKGNIDYPVSDNGDIFLYYRWYTKDGFKPSVGYRHYLPWGTAEFGYSRDSATLNTDTVWVEKRPELRVNMAHRMLCHSPFGISASANVGYWKEGYIQGNHRMASLRLDHAPMHWGSVNVQGYVGYQYDHYGFNNDTRSMPYWGVDAWTALTPAWNVWVGYYHTNLGDTDSPYPFDQVEMHRKVSVGTTYQLTRLDRLGVEFQYDTEHGDLKYVDYTWYRDMHSLRGELTYHAKQHRFDLRIRLKDF